jgi:hypothetical protein
MKMLVVAALCALALAGCSQETGAPPADTAESLAADPERLKELRAQCKADRAKVGDAVCNAVAEATRRRFLGDGKSAYPKDAPPAASAPPPAASKG